METTHTTIDIKTVHECNRCLGGKTLHPQASLINLEHPGWKGEAVKFEFYAILLFEDKVAGDSCCCGRRYYDFACATMVFLTPGEMFRMSSTNTLPDKGWLLAFHPDLIYGTSLDHTLCSYTFFSYDNDEALHLSLREKNKIESCFENIDEELHHPIDTYSRTIITRHIELLLDYCKRYYERQFVTREDENDVLMCRLERFIDGYIEQGKLAHGVFPTVEMCAGYLHLSPQYFKDVLKFSTGKTVREYVEAKRFAAAKQMLAMQGCASSQVATQLGYPSVQCFSVMFKRLTGVAPQEYRLLRNN